MPPKKKGQGEKIQFLHVPDYSVGERALENFKTRDNLRVEAEDQKTRITDRKVQAFEEAMIKAA